MAHTTDPAAIVVDQETLIQGVAKHFVQKVFGLEGMPWGTKFSDLEELAVQIGQAVSRSMMDQALAGQAQAGPAIAPVCGVCGTTVQAVPRANPGPSPPPWGRLTGEFRCQSIFSRGGRPRRRGSRTMPRRWEMTSTQSSAP